MSKNATDPNVIVLKGRLSYPALYKPYQRKDDDGQSEGEPKYSATVLLDKATAAEDIQKCKAIIKRVCEEQWKGKTVKLKDGKQLAAGTNGSIVLMGICLRDGVEKDDKEGYGDGVMFVSASCSMNRKPQVLQKKGGVFVEVPEETGLVYAGCNVAVSVRFWAQDNRYGKRVNAELRAVVFTGHNEPFGAAPVNVEEEFGDVDIPEDTGDEQPATSSSSKAATTDEW